MSKSPLGRAGCARRWWRPRWPRRRGSPPDRQRDAARVGAARGGGGGRGDALPAAAGPGVELQAVAEVAKPTHGRLVVDGGAERALRERGTSLLPVGVVGVRASSRRATRWRSARRGGDRQGDRELLGGRAAADQGAEDGGGARRDAAGDRGGRAPGLFRARLSLRSPYDREILRLPCRRSARWRPSRSTCSPTPRWSGTWARPSWRRSRSPARCSPAAFTLFNFLTYGTTAQVARLQGPARRTAATAGRAGALALHRYRRLPGRAARVAGVRRWWTCWVATGGPASWR